MATAMVRMAEMGPAGRRAMGVAGRQYVEEHHDLSKLGAEFAALLWPEVGPDGMVGTSPLGKPGLG